VAAWHEPKGTPLLGAFAFLLYVAAWAGLLGIILWKLWTALSPMIAP
jgi:hypothetical protein